MEDQNYILFENYIQRRLSEAEQETFETRLKDDSEFKAGFNTYKELSGFLEHKFGNEAGAIAFQDNLKKISTSYFEKQQPKKVIRFKPWQYAVAASVLLLIGLFMFNSSDPVYGDYANYKAISLTVRGHNNDLLKTAEIAFNTKDFAKADTAFKDLLEKDETNTELQFYRGIANIELNNYEVADNLLQILSKGTSVYKNKAIWYLALSKLKQNDTEACSAILKTLPEEADDYKTAQKLLKELH